MRFSDGVWRSKEGVEIRSAVEVGKVQTETAEFWQPFNLDNGRDSPGDLAINAAAHQPRVRLLCHTKPVVNPGGTLGTATIGVELSSPMDGVISFEAYHFRGKSHLRLVKPELFPGVEPSDRTSNMRPGAVNTQVEGTTLVGISLSSADKLITASVNCRPASFGISITGQDGNVLTTIGQESLQWILHTVARSDAHETEYSVTTGSDPYYRQPEKARKGYMCVSTSLAVGEKVYGLGERFGPFVKNGQAVELSNGDGGTSTHIAYKNVPFFMTNRGYALFYDHTESLSLEVQSDKMTKVQTSLVGERIRFHVIAGPSPKDILERYTYMTGRAPVIPDWSYGLWLSSSFLTKYDESTVMDIIERMEKEDIPLSVWHFDCFWSPAHEWCSFRWDPYNFPNPKAFLDRIHAKGIKVCVWINPYVAQESQLFPEGDEKGYYLKRSNGSTFQCDDWQAGLAFVDLTNPDAVTWWQGHLEAVVDTGVDTFKTDFGEKLPVDDVVYFDGSDPKAMHNQYSYLYNKAVYDVLARKRGINEACVFARAGTVGSQRLPVHWGGDCDSEWTGMAESLRGGLSLALSGYAYWAHDIGGFKAEGAAGGYALVTPRSDIYKRWIPFGLLSSHSRLHGSGSYRVPWLFGDEACRVLEKFTKLKHRLEPYIQSMSHQARTHGTPLLRAMLLEFPTEPTSWTLDTQYMFGDKLLVAPIFDEASVEYYVPPSSSSSSWTNILDGSEKLPGWQSEQYDYLNLPLLMRTGSALLVAQEHHRFGADLSQSGVTVIASLSSSNETIHATGMTSHGEALCGELTVRNGIVSVKVSGGCLSDQTSLEVLLIGDGIGLNNVHRAGARRKVGTCSSVELALP